MLNIDYNRRFGAEIEINAFDLRNKPEIGKVPLGIYNVGNIVRNVLKENVIVHKWGNDHYNKCWILKPDSSCGIEVCSPVLKGINGLKRICKVIDAFKLCKEVHADSRCAFHLHLDVSDLKQEDLHSIISWWIKCEPVFMDAVPFKRKINQYCQFIGLTDVLDDIDSPDAQTIFYRIGKNKYWSLNTWHYCLNQRKTIEFRIMDNETCLNSQDAKNWINLILHFVNQAVKRKCPKSYQKNDVFSGYCWLDPVDVFNFLGFEGEISSDLQEVKCWFLDKINQNILNGSYGYFSSTARGIALKQVQDLII